MRISDWSSDVCSSDLFDRCDPIDFFVGIEEIFETDHAEESAAEAHDTDMGAIEDDLILLGIVDRELDGFNGPEACRNHDDYKREYDAHAEDCDRDTPGQEAPLPDRVHILKHRGIDCRVVEGERNLEDCENCADPQDAERPVYGAGELPSVPAAESEREYGRSEEHTTELQSLMRISYAVLCLNNKK